MKPKLKTSNKENVKSADELPLGFPFQNNDFVEFMQDYGLSRATIKDIPWVSKTHLYAKQENLSGLIQALKEDPKQLEEIDCNGWTPLFYAAFYQKLKAVKLLSKKGADLTKVDIYQHHVLHYAKKDMQHSPVSIYLKDKIATKKDILAALAFEFQAIIEKEKIMARRSGKKILILLGELHGAYQGYQLEKALLKEVKAKGISTLLCELPSIQFLHSIEKKARDSFKMNLIAVDKHPKRNAGASIEERNEVIAQEINKIEQDAIFITGTEHLYGLLQEETSLIDRSKFHIVPFNISSLFCGPTSKMSVESAFSFEANSIIQIHSNTFTDSRRVSEKWNDAHKVAKKPKI
jgi:hypothetical protein